MELQWKEKILTDIMWSRHSLWRNPSERTWLRYSIICRANGFSHQGNISQIDDASKRHNIIYFTRECNTRRTSNNSFTLVKCIERHPVFYILYLRVQIWTTQIWNISFVLFLIYMVDRIKRNNQVISIFVKLIEYVILHDIKMFCHSQRFFESRHYMYI